MKSAVYLTMNRSSCRRPPPSANLLKVLRIPSRHQSLPFKDRSRCQRTSCWAAGVWAWARHKVNTSPKCLSRALCSAHSPAIGSTAPRPLASNYCTRSGQTVNWMEAHWSMANSFRTLKSSPDQDCSKIPLFSSRCRNRHHWPVKEGPRLAIRCRANRPRKCLPRRHHRRIPGALSISSRSSVKRNKRVIRALPWSVQRITISRQRLSICQTMISIRAKFLDIPQRRMNATSGRERTQAKSWVTNASIQLSCRR